MELKGLALWQFGNLGASGSCRTIMLQHYLCKWNQLVLTLNGSGPVPVGEQSRCQRAFTEALWMLQASEALSQEEKNGKMMDIIKELGGP